jgi:hypothetical protein
MAAADAFALPFIMMNVGVANLFAAGLADGPFRSNTNRGKPVDIACTPSAEESRGFVYPANPGYSPRRISTRSSVSLRVSEKWQEGAMTRQSDVANELFPELFVR